MLIAIAVVVLYLLSSIKIITEYERAVIFRLGHVLPNSKGPGVILIFKPFDRMVRISLRVDTIEVPPQDVITRDNVMPVKVNAVIYFRVIDLRLGGGGGFELPLCDLATGADHAAQRAGRSGTGRSAEQARDAECEVAEHPRPAHASPWGVKVTMVEVKQVDIAEQMIRAIARQAEAERERRAKIIHAEGEYTAAEKLAMAAEVIQRQPAALQLRYLQTLVEIGAEKNTTVVFPLPLDILSNFNRALETFANRGDNGSNGLDRTDKP